MDNKKKERSAIRDSFKKEVSLKELQQILRRVNKDLRITFQTLTKREKDILAKTVKLSEEVGELSNDVLSILSLQRASKLERFSRANMYEEFADVVLAVFLLANAVGVDMERAVNEKLIKVLEKYTKDR